MESTDLKKREIAFIINTDDMLSYEECRRYLMELEVPNGYDLDIIRIQEADTLAEAYQAAMQESHAKYKIYLRQNLFIRSRNFLNDIVKIFESDISIGMIGMCGTDRLVKSGEVVQIWETGNLEIYDGRCVLDRNAKYDDIGNESGNVSYIKVQSVCDAILATQYDISWSGEAGMDETDYVSAHCKKMEQAGYQTVVPVQKQAWCFYDKGEDAPVQKSEQTELSAIRRQLIQLIEYGAYDDLKDIAKELRELWVSDIQIREIMNLIEIYEMEEASVMQGHSEWFTYRNWERIYKEYKQVYFALRRIEWGMQDDGTKTLEKAVESGRISRDAIRKISALTLVKTERIYQKLLSTDDAGGSTDQPLVSVIMLVYNGEEHIARTIESVLSQTYQNMEYIIIDDASADSSRKIITDYAGSDKRVRSVFLKENHHICYAGNVGFREAKGKYIALIGHDDIWQPDKIEKQVSFLEEHSSYGLCFTWADVIDENENTINGSCLGLSERFCADNRTKEQWCRKLFFERNSFCAPSAFVRRSALEKAGFYRYALVQLQDYDLWLRVLRDTPVYVIQEKLTKYRQFRQKGKNLSFLNQQTSNRAWHENQWIKENFIAHLEPVQFLAVFDEDMRYQAARSEKEIDCEKAFLLWKIGNCFSEKWFIELLEDEEYRYILEKKYRFTLKDFYEMNTQALCFDASGNGMNQ